MPQSTLATPSTTVLRHYPKPGKNGQKRGSACMKAGLAGHVWSFDELFAAVLG
jgi:hypothetical protein